MKPLSKRNQATLRRALAKLTDNHDWMMFFFLYSRAFAKRAANGAKLSKRAHEFLSDSCVEFRSYANVTGQKGADQVIENTCEIKGCAEAKEPNAKRCELHYCDGETCFISWCEEPRYGLGGVAPSCFCKHHDLIWASGAWKKYSQDLNPEQKFALWVAEQRKEDE